MLKNLLLLTILSVTSASVTYGGNHAGERIRKGTPRNIVAPQKEQNSSVNELPEQSHDEGLFGHHEEFLDSSEKDTSFSEDTSETYPRTYIVDEENLKEKYQNVLNNTFTALRDQGGLPALRVIADALRERENIYLFQTDGFRVLKSIAAYLMGIGQLPNIAGLGSDEAQSAFDHVFKKGKTEKGQKTNGSVGISSTKEGPNSDKRAEMVSLIKVFNTENSSSHTPTFYQIIHTLLNKNKNQTVQGHLKAILNYIHMDWAILEREQKLYSLDDGDAEEMLRTESEKGISLNIPNAPELDHIEKFISGEKIRKEFDIDGKKVTINRAPLQKQEGEFPTIKHIIHLNDLPLNCDFSRTLVCINLDNLENFDLEKDGRALEDFGIPLQLKTQYFSSRGAATLFLNHTSKKKTNKACLKHIQEQSDKIYATQTEGHVHIISLNRVNMYINPIVPFLHHSVDKLEGSHQPRSHSVLFSNNYLNPTLFFEQKNPGDAISELLEKANISAPYTVLMIHTDKDALASAQQALEEKGYTFVGVHLLAKED